MASSSSNGGVPPGFRFHPTDEELLHYYLKKKVLYQKFDMEVLREVDLNRVEPWELQERCRIGSAPQNEWYFFSHKDKKYPTGTRTNRATSAGFWKATGRDKCIRNSYKKIGMRKTLVFYRGRAPRGQKTDWIMHEYRLEDDHDPHGNQDEDSWVVCKVFKKKHLFKIGNESGLTNNSSSINQPNSIFMHKESLYIQQHDQQNPRNSSSGIFDHEKPELALQFLHMQNPQNSFMQSQPPLQNLKSIVYDCYNVPSDSNTVIAKQLILTNPRDYEVEGGTGRDQGMNEWGVTVSDGFVSVTSHLGNKDLSKQVSLRGEMDFWSYGKQ